ncbi:MAG: cyclic GMP-AMP synthase DncV-like nucleotidyltransferase [Fusobacteriaceae bacterium]
MSLQIKFEKFNENIRITWQDEKMQEIREKNESIETDIKKKFKDEGYPIQEIFNQGSYASNTTILPLDEEDYDIDKGIVIKEEHAPEDPKEPKKKLKDVLVNRNLKDPKLKVPCVTAQYYKQGNKKFHIDYPIYKIDSDGKYFLAIAKETSNEDNTEWQEVEIKELIKWVDGKNGKESENLNTEDRKQYKRLVRYMKKWRNHNFSESNRKNIYSIGLTVMIKEQFSASITSDGVTNDLDSLYDTILNILNHSYFSFVEYDKNSKAKYDLNVYLPKKPHSDIFNKHGITVGTLFRNKLLQLKTELEKVKIYDSLKDKCSLLNKIFGVEFPLVEEKNNSNSAKSFSEYGYVSSPQGA